MSLAASPSYISARERQIRVATEYTPYRRLPLVYDGFGSVSRPPLQCAIDRSSMSPIRRHHKKSRLGCDQCRQRRIKCDEQLPGCASCIRRGITCHYIRANASRNRNATKQDLIPDLLRTVTASTSPSTSSDLPVILSPTFLLEPTRLRELELMYFWCAETYKSFPSVFGSVLREHVAREAFRFDFLMESLLALTSLHIAHETEDRDTAHRHMSAALYYQEKAIVGLRSNLTAIEKKNCNAVFGTAMLVMINAVVSPLLSDSSSSQPRSSPAALLMLVDLLKGTHVINQASHVWLVQGPFACLFQPSSVYPPISIRIPAHHLHNLADSEPSPRSRQSYKHAIDELACAAHSTKTVLPWLMNLQHEFLERLKDEDPAALAIVMCWAVLLEQFSDIWWARYAGRQLVEDLATMLEGSGPKVEVVTLWCRRCIETNTENTD